MTTTETSKSPRMATTQRTKNLQRLVRNQMQQWRPTRAKEGEVERPLQSKQFDDAAVTR